MSCYSGAKIIEKAGLPKQKRTFLPNPCDFYVNPTACMSNKGVDPDMLRRPPGLIMERRQGHSCPRPIYRGLLVDPYNEAVDPPWMGQQFFNPFYRIFVDPKGDSGHGQQWVNNGGSIR